jgi:hypothetical protein
LPPFQTGRILKSMGVLPKRAFSRWHGLLAMFLAAAALPLRADEIRLKDGKKLYGVIVAYEENMFKVKTEFGYVLVEKDKIASIIPTTPPGNPETGAPAKNGEPGKQPAANAAKAESAVATGAEAATEATPASAKIATPNPTAASPASGKRDKSSKINSAVKPEPPAKTGTSDAAAPAIKASSPAATPGAATSSTTIASAAAAPPKAPEPPPIQEEVQGNIYINHPHGFRMYKAPSWQVIDDARNALPNAIVAMGTQDESSLLVVGKEATKQSLDAAAATVERRLRDVYSNYQQTSQRKTVVGGLPAVEFRYIGKADDHDWSGILVVIARGGDIFTVLGMTYADSDLIQIQENVIAKSVASLSFDAH